LSLNLKLKKTFAIEKFSGAWDFFDITLFFNWVRRREKIGAIMINGGADILVCHL
jgi:hypothetical protein